MEEAGGWVKHIQNFHPGDGCFLLLRGGTSTVLQHKPPGQLHTSATSENNYWNRTESLRTRETSWVCYSPTLSFVFCSELTVDCGLRRTSPETVLNKIFTDLNNRSDRNIRGSAVFLHLLSTSNTKHLLSYKWLSLHQYRWQRLLESELLESLVEGLRSRVNVL